MCNFYVTSFLAILEFSRVNNTLLCLLRDQPSFNNPTVSSPLSPTPPFLGPPPSLATLSLLSLSPHHSFLHHILQTLPSFLTTLSLTTLPPYPLPPPFLRISPILLKYEPDSFTQATGTVVFIQNISIRICIVVLLDVTVQPL